MPSNLDNLLSIKSAIIAKLAAVYAEESLKPTYTVNGQSFSWDEHRKMLMEQLKELNELIQAESPYELKSQMY